MNADTDPVLSLRNVDVHFDNSGFLERLFSDPRTIQAVTDVSLDIFENDVVALVGESGCGKTTLGKTAIGLHEPTRGVIEYRGQDIWETKKKKGEIPYAEIRRSLQIVHQDPGSSLDPNKTILSILSTPLKKWHSEMDIDDRETNIYRLLRRLNITPVEDYATRYPHQLSGGEQQRIALGRALLMQPDVILADEAVSALDVSLRVEMMDLMLELQDMFNTSFLFISHDFANARYLAKKADGRIGVMYLGELVEIGSADDVLDNPHHPYTQVLDWATPVLDPKESTTAKTEAPRVRSIDVPDPSDPPSGCRFHTRCMEAREVCKRESPELLDTAMGSAASCFRVDDQHEYWESSELDE